jgi:rhodanese-related sulfurtransferase
VAKRASSDPTVLVDVRHPDEFDRYRISGSINVPLHLIKTKSFLKGSPVVLINEGRTSFELEEACKSLKAAGFRQVSVLEGGIHSWVEAKHPVDGDAFAIRALNRLPADELFTERAYDDWLVIDVSAGKHRDLYHLLPANIVKVDASSKKPLAAGLRQAIQSRGKSNANVKIVVASDTDAVYENLEPELRNAGYSRVLYLAGGLAGYRSYVANQVAMWNEKNKPQRLPSCRG